MLFPNTVLHADVDGFATISARFGYAVSQAFLLYGKVGWGSYRTKLSAVNTVTGVEFSGAGRNQSGLDAGVGGEWMLAPNWSLWVEWDHIFADDKSVFFPNLAGGTTATVRRDLDKVLVASIGASAAHVAPTDCRVSLSHVLPELWFGFRPSSASRNAARASSI